MITVMMLLLPPFSNLPSLLVDNDGVLEAAVASEDALKLGDVVDIIV